MPSESIAEQIAANIKTELEAIVAGTDYHYTPQIVARVEQWRLEDLDASRKHFYLLRDTGDESVFEGESEFGEVEKLLEFFILAARLDKRTTLSAFKESTPSKGTIRNRIVRDVEKKLREDMSRGGLAMTTEVTDVKREIFVDGWVLVELAVIVQYSHAFDTP